MRYRPLANTGMAISAVSLSLADSTALRASDWIALVYAGLESGINAFEVSGCDPALIDGFGQAIKAVERNLLFIAWRLGWVVAPTGAMARDFSAESLTATLEAALARTGLDYIDAGILDDPAASELPPQALEAMTRLRDAGRIRMLGVSGGDGATDAYISTGAFDLIATTFNLMSGWKERHRLKAAVDRDMAVIGYGYQPDIARDLAHAPPKPTPWGRGAPHPLAGAGSYAFLDETPQWTAAELCLGYALTEPSLCTVQIAADRVEQIEQLAAVSERELPSNVPAQIEMARFSPASLPAAAEVALDRRRQAS
jgi:aryl-alcohol dehydrogenase-like predicted oxidoreductase